jgi:chromosome segregation ATPase
MKNGNRAKEQLIEEVNALRHRVAELEKLEAECTQIREQLQLELIEHRMAEAALQESREKYQTMRNTKPSLKTPAQPWQSLRKT